MCDLDLLIAGRRGGAQGRGHSLLDRVTLKQHSFIREGWGLCYLDLLTAGRRGGIMRLRRLATGPSYRERRTLICRGGLGDSVTWIF